LIQRNNGASRERERRTADAFDRLKNPVPATDIRPLPDPLSHGLQVAVPTHRKESP
jgi:hypothetical protein